ncbi:MAG: helix-hairpin-helix domain-containing protein [Candidatus Poribacteria bacterium]|nr:helix-hairpin-helix domain-containing protein [Candidatus Poribacteria bacterium]
MHFLDQQYRNVLIFLVVVILAGSGYWMLKRFNPTLFLGEPDFVVNDEGESSSGQPNPIPTGESGSSAEIVVHVAGAVESPGVYHLQVGSRVEKAVEIAGGATEKADIHKLNLAAKISDGQRIYVPALRQLSPLPGGANQSLSGSPASNSPISNQELLIDLNVATLEQLQTLPRIGPVMARRIIEYRETNGSFSSVDDLVRVRGIGDKTLEQFRHLVDVR